VFFERRWVSKALRFDKITETKKTNGAATKSDINLFKEDLQ
jgi:hypothetical protein